MTRSRWSWSAPSLVVAIGVIASTWLMVLTGHSAWMVAGGSLLQASVLVGADMLVSRLRGESPAPRPGAILLAAGFLLACAIVALRDPALVAQLVPVLGGGSGVTLLMRSDGMCGHRARP